MSELKQRVPLTRDRAGADLFITVEWLKDLKAALTNSTTLTVTPADLLALQTAVSILQSDLAGLLVEMNALKARVKKLEGGYQV